MPQSQGPGGINQPGQKTPATSGPAQLRGTPAAGSAFFEGLVAKTKAAGIYSFDLEVIDANGDSCAQTYSMEVMPQSEALKNGGPVVALKKTDRSGGTLYAQAASDCVNVDFATDIIPDAFEGIEYYAEIMPSGGQAPYAYTMTDGSLPDGLGLTVDTPPAPFIGYAPFVTATPTQYPDFTNGPVYSPSPSSGGGGGGGGGGGSSACDKYLAEWNQCKNDPSYTTSTCINDKSIVSASCPSSPGTLCGDYLYILPFTGSSQLGTLPVDCSPYKRQWHVYCSYSNQTEAVQCGMPFSGARPFSGGSTCWTAVKQSQSCGFLEGCAVSVTANSGCPSY